LYPSYIFREQAIHLLKHSPYITFIWNVEISPLTCYGIIPNSVLSQSSAISFARAPFFKGWFNREVRSSTPIELAMQHKAGLETVHY